MKSQAYSQYPDMASQPKTFNHDTPPQPMSGEPILFQLLNEIMRTAAELEDVVEGLKGRASMLRKMEYSLPAKPSETAPADPSDFAGMLAYQIVRITDAKNELMIINNHLQTII